VNILVRSVKISSTTKIFSQIFVIFVLISLNMANKNDILAVLQILKKYNLKVIEYIWYIQQYNAINRIFFRAPKIF
jgi:hypothetical protein